MDFFQTCDKEKVSELLNNIKKYSVREKIINAEKDLITSPTKKYKLYGNLWNYLFGEIVEKQNIPLSKFLIKINYDYTNVKPGETILDIRTRFANLKKEFVTSKTIDNGILKKLSETLFFDYYDASLLQIDEKPGITNTDNDILIFYILNDIDILSSKDIFTRLLYFLNDVMTYNKNYKVFLKDNKFNENELYQEFWKLDATKLTAEENKYLNEQIENVISLKNLIYTDFDYMQPGDFNILTTYKLAVEEYKNKVIETVDDYLNMKFLEILGKFFDDKSISATTISSILTNFETNCKVFKEIFKKFLRIIDSDIKKFFIVDSEVL